MSLVEEVMHRVEAVAAEISDAMTERFRLRVEQEHLEEEQQYLDATYYVQVCNEINPQTGKPAHTNETLRNAAIMSLKRTEDLKHPTTGHPYSWIVAQLEQVRRGIVAKDALIQQFERRASMLKLMAREHVAMIELQASGNSPIVSAM